MASRERDIRAVALFCLDPVVDSASCKLIIIQDGPRFIQAKQFFRLKEVDAVPTTLYNLGVAATSHAPSRPHFAFLSPPASGLPSGCSASPEPSRARPAVRCRWLGAVPYNLCTCNLLTSVRFTGAVHRCAPNARGQSWVSC